MSAAYGLHDTIAAIATPPGEGGVAIIRLSGKDAVTIADRIFSGNVFSYKSHTVHYGKVKNSDGSVIDDALVIPMLAPNSYTGENVVEIHCHGGSLVSKRVLEATLSVGAIAARPGEFTFRAFINERIDLAQAEAVQNLIAAKSDLALNAAENQLQGKLSVLIHSYQERLTEIAAIFEAWVDFPEEGLEFATQDEITEDIQSIINDMQSLLETFDDGRLLHEGLVLCLAGSPNVGKSSLMNALIDKERAIVTDIPGTTRDIIEEDLRIHGLNVRLTDTAGIRTTNEVVEQEGIRRSKQAMLDADLVLLVLDSSKPLSKEDNDLVRVSDKEKTLIVWNKIDLPQVESPILNFDHIVKLSAKQKLGLDQLHQAIDLMIWKKGPPSKEEIVLTSTRHKEALSQAISSCLKVINDLMNGQSPEFLIFDIRDSLGHLSKIIGRDITEDILSSIFSKFCIGK
ncbi:MAG: tRNA uridine-5-carboxymethylaminomethyl(34) synthesis GTPase MnmE [Parachlamydiales bacterium]|nr:tRNA uridine-5-carboxymethylaminomethyl(34) synthesis GTPase MnmE [Parachlamydiales bacterium]